MARTTAEKSLLAIWALLLFGTFFFWPAPERPDARHIPYWASLASSLTLVTYAWLGVKLAADAGHRQFLKLFAIGMTCGFLGDLCMASGFLVGAIAVFSVGHIFYMRGILSLGTWSKIWLAPALVAGVAAWYVLAVGSDRAPEWLRWATLGYCLLLAALAGVGMARAVHQPIVWVIAVGAIVFFISDAAIAARIFKPHLLELLPAAIRADFIWLTYGPAQLLIVGGARLAARR